MPLGGDSVWAWVYIDRVLSVTHLGVDPDARDIVDDHSENVPLNKNIQNFSECLLNSILLESLIVI